MNFRLSEIDEILTKKNYFCCILFTSLSIIGISLFRFESVPGYDPRDYLQIARSLYEGKGYVTKIVTPLTLSINENILNHPDFMRPPIYPALISFGYYAFGPSEIVPVIINSLFYVGLIFVVTHLGRDIAGRKIGQLAGILILISPSLVRYITNGRPEVLFTFLLWVIVLLLLREESPFLVGTIMGLAYLTRFNLLFFLPGILYLSWKCYEKTWATQIRLLGGFLLVLTPWFIRNYILVSTPYYHHQLYELAMFNDVHPFYSLYYSFNPPDPFLSALNNPLSLISKFFSGIIRLLPSIMRIFYNPVTVIIAGVGIFRVLTETKTKFNILCTFVGISFLSNFMANSLVHPVARHLFPLFPFVALSASYAFFWRPNLDRSKWGQLDFRLSLVLIFILIANILSLLSLNLSNSLPENELKEIRTLVPPSEQIITNAPDEIAWYADRTAILAPTWDDYQKHLNQVKYVFISKRTPFIASKKYSVEKNYTRNKYFHSKFKLIREFSSGRKLFKKKNK